MDNNFKLIEELGTLSETENGYTKRLIKSEWYGRTPQYEIRGFDPDGKPLKRQGLTFEELQKLKQILNEHKEI